MKSPRRLVLIDGYSNIFRAFYAIRNLSNSRGEPTNAVFGFVQMLRKLLRDQAPDLIGVALDLSGPTVRDEKFEDYKANRAPIPEDLVAQVPWIRTALEAYRIPVLEMERYEADDVLGTLARKAAAAGYEVVIVSSDKDLMQLVDDHIKLFHTGRDKLYDPAAVEEDFGVPPAQVVEVLALKGDAVDNVPGVPGIGEKGAVQLVRDFGSVEALLERAAEVTRKSYREGLESHREQALLSKELVTIHTDLPIDFDAQALALEEPDLEALRRLFREMEFRTLLAEVEGALPTAAIEVARAIDSVEHWHQVTADLPRRLTAVLVVGEKPVGLALAAGAERLWFADFRRPEIEANVLAMLAGWLRDADRELAGHDLKELLRLVPLREAPRAVLWDAMLMSYVLEPSARGHGVEDLASARLAHRPMAAAEAGWSGDTQPEIEDTRLLAFAGERVRLTERLVDDMSGELERTGLAEVYSGIERPLIPVLVRMEETGILLDQDFLAAMSGQLAEELTALEGEIFDLAGETFNLNSPRQLGVILFEKLDYPVLGKTRKTKSYSTSAEVLQRLAEQGYPLPGLILKYREISKLKSTYVDALPALVGADGRVHTRYQQAVAATGRLSSVNPNLQNIPIRTELGQQIRRGFVAPAGRLLLVADYNQIELRVLAHISGDPVLVAAFAVGQDIHRTTAAAVFGVAPELVTAEQRRAAKTINFGIIYGISPFGLARNLGIQQSEAELFIRAYFDRYAGVREYVETTLAAAAEAGKVETLYGRVRWLPDIKSTNHNLRENARRMAINARIQGTAADLMKMAMINLDARLCREQPDSALLLTVHDELVLEVPDDDLEAVAALVRAEMEGVASLAVPLVVDIGSGPSWFVAKG